MTYGKKNLQFLLTGAVVAFAVAAPVAQAAPAAPADVQVCNQATHNSLGGNLLATDGDTGSAARFLEGLKAHPGKGAGLVNAAAQSRALSVCIVPETGETVVVPPVYQDPVSYGGDS